ncbi:MAG: ABC transporter substrate-binding protein [Comamonas sp.]
MSGCRHALRRARRCGLALALWLLAAGSPAWAASDLVRIGIQLEPSSLDITTTSAATASEITYANVYEGLTYIDGSGQVRPRLATEWKLSEDGKVVDFTLRKQVVYHDGKPFNAYTAVSSLRRMLKMTNANAYLEWFDKIESVEANGEHVLRIRLSAPDGLLTYALALPGAVLVHPDTAQTNALQPMGTGPYRVQNWERNRLVRLVRNASWWGPARPQIREAQFLFMSTSFETESMLAEGRIDALSSVTRLTGAFASRSDYVMSSRGVEGKQIVALNNARAPLSDIRVRRALSHAINRREFRDIYGQLVSAVPIGTHFSPNHPAYVDLVNRYPYDVAKARELLRQAQVEPGTVLRLAVPPTDYGRYGGLIVARQLEAIGLKIEIVTMGWPTWLEEVFKKKDYDMTLIMHVEPMDLNIYARGDYYFNYDNRAFRPIWEKVRSARSEAERNEWLAQAQRQVTEDAVNLFIQMRPERNFIRRGLAGMWEHCPVPVFAIENLRWQN